MRGRGEKPSEGRLHLPMLSKGHAHLLSITLAPGLRVRRWENRAGSGSLPLTLRAEESQSEAKEEEERGGGGGFNFCERVDNRARHAIVENFGKPGNCVLRMTNLARTPILQNFALHGHRSAAARALRRPSSCQPQSPRRHGTRSRSVSKMASRPETSLQNSTFRSAR